MKLDVRQLATTLAALRLWQDTNDTSKYDTMFEETHDEAAIPQLTNDEIDQLCEELNMQDQWVGVPTNADQAVLYTKLGADYLEVHAPDRLTPAMRGILNPGGIEGLAHSASEMLRVQKEQSLKIKELLTHCVNQLEKDKPAHIPMKKIDGAIRILKMVIESLERSCKSGD